jgi:1-deoxy-D-xylulose-5-phosphate reductoisomerase
MKRLCILGSTGSVGQNCLRVVRSLPGRFQVVALGAGKNVPLLAEQVAEFGPELVAMGEERFLESLRQQLQALGYRQPVRLCAGEAGLVEAATLPDVDMVVSACHGVTGLRATFEAVRAGKQVGLANKETLVVAGELVMQAAREHGAAIIPIDSEHSAVHQCLRAGKRHEIRRLILTGSGGPFLKTPWKDFPAITPERALQHPIWKMGGRITIDSATLMNKGLEIIEAHWLFGLAPQQIEVLIHPESVIHSMVEFRDGAVVAQLGMADMRIPIQYALTYPERLATNGNLVGMDLAALRRLHFAKPDTKRFPCLELGRNALETGGFLPCVVNAADEVAVEAFLAREIGFMDIPKVIEAAMQDAPPGHPGSLAEVVECDRESRQRAKEWIKKIKQSRNVPGNQ